MTSIAVWFVTWFVLHFAWRKKSMNLRYPVTITLILVVIAFLATFPLLFQLADLWPLAFCRQMTCG